MPDPIQVPISGISKGWRAELSKDWDVLGPFPIHSREQHFLSPSFPLNLSEVIDFNKTWPSSYADNGRVSWSKTRLEDNGDLKVSFPNIRWNILRATEGWAAMQHHAVLGGSLMVYPPTGESSATVKPPQLLVQLIQGSFFTLLPSGDNDVQAKPLVPEWHAGNIYDMERALPRIVDFPVSPSKTLPTMYNIFISGDYEIRLFGDPATYNSDVPIQSLKLSVDVEYPIEHFVREPTQDVICDFVDGFAFGDAIGVGLRSVSEWWTVTYIKLVNAPAEDVTLTLLRETRIAPSQMRIVPIRISQTAPFHGHDLQIVVTMVSETTSTNFSVSLDVKHHPRWTPSDFVPIKSSYFYAQSMPTAFVVLPPIKENVGEPRPPIICLHGAGVDIIELSFWADTLPRMKISWVVIPTGRTSWGLDWHGPSTGDAWGSLDALVSILHDNPVWHPWKLTVGTPVVVMGHSNGGQGTWHIASRYPDRVLAIVPAAAYIKSQAYVPLTLSRSAHFLDPSLRAILETSLTPDDNDLFLSNLVNMPILAVHGGVDENVPVWHSREAVSVVQSWMPDANVTFREDPGKPHWYPSVLNNEEARSFLDRVLALPLHPRPFPKSFTLTVSVPAESGPLYGFRVTSLTIPGRLARLHVETAGDNLLSVTTTNVHSFVIDFRVYGTAMLSVDGSRILISEHINTVQLQSNRSKIWQVESNPDFVHVQSSGRMQTILMTNVPIIIVIPDEMSSRELSVALRIAHDLNLYHRLDTEIIRSCEALQSIQEGTLDSASIVAIGDPLTPFVHWNLNQKRTPFEVKESKLVLKDRLLADSSLGILFLHPHPGSTKLNMLFISGTDDAGLERAARLFPIRTGITVPDWLIIGGDADQVGAAGLIGAGVWGVDWSWNEPVSWLY